MNFRKRLSVHLECEQDFVDFYFSPWDGDGVVVDFAFFEIGVCA